MNHALLKLLVLTAISVCIAMDYHAQSLKQVRLAVDDYFESNDKSDAAKRSLTEWGNDALVHLKTLAGSASSARAGRLNERSWNIVCAADTIGTIEAMDFLVEVLDGQTGIKASNALHLMPKGVDPPFSEMEPYRHLRDHPRFRPAVRRFAEEGSWLDMGYAAEIAASLNWTDFEPLIERMLDDPNVSLRRTAAEALGKLTGRAVEPEVPSAHFPAREPIPELLGELNQLPTKVVHRVSEAFPFQRGEEPPTLMFGDGTTFAPLLDQSSTTPKLSFGVMAIAVDVLEVAGSPRQLISLSSSSGFGGAGADSAISWNDSGEELWRYEPPRSGLDAFAILYGAKGPYGVVFGPGGGDEGIVALDERGDKLWTAPAIVLYELRTHAELPGVLLFVGGEHVLLTHSPAGLQPRNRHLEESYLYSSTGVLYPGRDGTPEMAIAGSGEDSTPTLIGQNARGNQLWSVTFPDRVAELRLLEVAGRDRLLVVAINGGGLFVLNTSGTLLWEGQIPHTGGKGRVMILDLVAGGYGNGQAAVAVGTSGGYYYCDVNVHAIPTTR